MHRVKRFVLSHSYRVKQSRKDIRVVCVNSLPTNDGKCRHDFCELSISLWEVFNARRYILVHGYCFFKLFLMIGKELSDSHGVKWFVKSHWWDKRFCKAIRCIGRFSANRSDNKTAEFLLQLLFWPDHMVSQSLTAEGIDICMWPKPGFDLEVQSMTKYMTSNLSNWEVMFHDFTWM